MKYVGAIVLLVLAAFAAPAYSMRGPGRGLKSTNPECTPGNIQPGDVSCSQTGWVKCSAPDPLPDGGGFETVTCSDGTVVKVTFNADKSVTFTVNGVVRNDVEAWLKGGNGYCHWTSGPYDYTTRFCGNGNKCGFSHAVFCVQPCQCSDKIQAALNAVQPAFNNAGYCPGSTLPDASITVCGATITAHPNAVSSCAGTVAYAASCPTSSTVYTSTAKTYTATDSNLQLVAVPGGCPTATSTCFPTTGASAGEPHCSMGAGCKVEVAYTVTGACGTTIQRSLFYNVA